MKLERTIGRCNINAECLEVGGDLVIIVYGGDAPHVGSASVAQPVASCSRDAMTVSVSTLAVAGHRDYVIANIIAERVAKSTGRVVSVVAGIHIDDAKPSEIEDIVSAARDIACEISRHYEKAE